jgi:hypothetical protein
MPASAVAAGLMSGSLPSRCDHSRSVLFDLREQGRHTDEELKSEMTAIGLLSEVPDGPTWIITGMRLADED